MKLAIITVIIMSLGISFDVQAGKPDRHGARKSSPPKAAKSYKPRNYRKEPNVRRQSQPQANRPQRPNVSNSNNRARKADRPMGFGSPNQSITNKKPFRQNSRDANLHYREKPSRITQKSPSRNTPATKPSQRANDRNYNRITGQRDNRQSVLQNRSERRISQPDRMTSREIRGTGANRDSLRPSDRDRAGNRARVVTGQVPDFRSSRDITRNSYRDSNHNRARISTRLPESMPLRRHNDSNKGNINRYNNARKAPAYRENKRDDFRYKQHRWLVNKQKHRRHTVNMPRQLHRYRSNHYRGKHRHGNWHRGHNHHHYDYRYRYLYNPYQWYDDYYYHAYLNWRWYSPSHWQMSGYYNHYMDPYYCPDDFGEFIATLAVGALILSW